MDVLIVVVACGCAVLGAWGGGLRMASTVVAVIAGILAGRWAGPPAVALFAKGSSAQPAARILATVIVGIVAAGVVLLAGRGLRKGMETLRLGWVDRLGGLLLGGAAALAIMALLLGLAALGGHPPATPWATWLSQMGQGALAVQGLSNSNARPSSSPSTPTKSGQQPK